MKKIIKSVALLLSLNMFVTIGYSQSDILVPGDYMKYKELYEEAQKAKSEWEVVIKKINEQTIDLGLSVRWATCNLGASASENAGNSRRKWRISVRYLQVSNHSRRVGWRKSASV